MTVVVGYPPDGSGTPEIELAAMLSRTTGEDIVVATVVPKPWYPGMARIDAEYHTELAEIAAESLEEARSDMPSDVKATYIRHQAGSIPRGLLEVAEKYGAAMVVVGSSAAGPFGHVALGSATDPLLHSSPVPIVLAPRGFRSSSDRVGRLMIAYGGSPVADDLVAAAGRLAARLGVALQLVSFAIRRRPPVPNRVGPGPEDAITAEWTAETVALAQKVLEGVPGADQLPKPAGIEIGRGKTWADAVEDIAWCDGDLLVLGSSSLGPISRVFLGSRAGKILGNSPVPVVVVPRSVVEDELKADPPERL